MTCYNNTSNINKTFILEPLSITGGAPTLSACTGMYTNDIIGCTGDTIIHLESGYTEFNSDIVPLIDDTQSVGTPMKRFRELNSYSGNVSIWSASTKIYTPEINLGDDSFGNTRTITANNSVIQNDILLGGDF